MLVPILRKSNLYHRFLYAFEVLNFSLLRHGLLTLQCLPSTHFYTDYQSRSYRNIKNCFVFSTRIIYQLISVTEMSCGGFHCLDKIASTRQDVKQTDFAFYGRFNGFLLQPFCLIVKCAIVLLGILIARSSEIFLILTLPIRFSLEAFILAEAFIEIRTKITITPKRCLFRCLLPAQARYLTCQYRSPRAHNTNTSTKSIF